MSESPPAGADTRPSTLTFADFFPPDETRDSGPTRVLILFFFNLNKCKCWSYVSILMSINLLNAAKGSNYKRLSKLKLPFTNKF